MKSQCWSAIREAVCLLFENIRKYAEYLDSQNKSMKLRHSQLESTSDVDVFCILNASTASPGSNHYNVLHI